MRNKVRKNCPLDLVNQQTLNGVEDAIF